MKSKPAPIQGNAELIGVCHAHDSATKKNIQNPAQMSATTRANSADLSFIRAPGECELRKDPCVIRYSMPGTYTRSAATNWV